MSASVKVQRNVRRRPEGEGKSPAVQRNGWEQQAEESSARFVRGRPANARWLTPAPAASYRAPASPGNPLPAALRTELEHSFNAGLAAVRIHRDPASTAAVQQEDAVAFAAGSDIFLDQSAASLDSVAGRELIAHEVAHVLQQTGREDGLGRLQATAVEGPGLIQRQGDGSDLRHRLQLDFDLLTSSHRANADDPKQFDLVVQAVQEVLGNTLDETSDKSAAFEAAILRKDPKLWNYVVKSDVYAGYFFDILKFTDRFEGAAVVLQQQLLLLTYAPLAAMAAFYVEHLDKEAAFFDKIAPLHELIFPFWPGRFYDTFIVYLYGPTRAVPTLADRGGTSYAEALKAYTKDQATRDLSDNELISPTLEDLGKIDKQRIEVMTQFHDEVAGTLDPDKAPVAFRFALSVKMQRWASDRLPSDTRLLKRLDTRIGEIAKQAIDYWNSVFDAKLTFDKTLPGTTTGPADQRKPTTRVIPEQKLFTEEIPDALLAASKLFAKVRPNGDLPSPDAYAAQLASAAEGLKKFALEHLELKLIALARTGSGNDDFAVATGGFLLWFQKFLKQVQSYDLAGDKAFEKQFPGSPDVRFSHRLRLAKTIDLLIQTISADRLPHWKTLEGQTADVRENRSEGHSRLAILGEWKPQLDSPIRKIADDFSGPFPFIDTFEALTGAQLANAYQLIYSVDLTDELKTQIATADKDFQDLEGALKKKSILNQAIDVVDPRSRPIRYVASDWDYAGNSNQLQTIGDQPDLNRDAVFATLVRMHPKTRQFELGEAGKGRQVLYALSPYSQQTKELFLWSIPNSSLVFTALHRIDGLNTLISSLSGMPIEDVRNLPDIEWMKQLSETARSGGDINASLDAVLKQAKADLEVQFRLSVNHERLLLVALFKAVLATYTGLADKTRGYPLAILRRISDFGRFVLPRVDQQAQVTALLLAIAPDLLKALKDETHFDIITGWYGLIVLAIAGSEGPQLDHLARVVPDDTERNGLIANRPKFDTLLAAFDKQREHVQERFGFRSEDGNVLKALNYEEEIKPHVPFPINGTKFELVKVYQIFTYNPAYGYEGTPAYRAPLFNGKVYGKDYIPTGALLFEMLVEGRRFKVTDKDTRELDQYSNVIELEANIIGLRSLNDVIMGFTEFALDAAELIPGVGQGIAAARIVAGVVEFLASGEWEDIKDVLKDHFLERLHSLWDHIKEALSLENIWLFLLFGNPVFDWFKDRVLSPREQRVQSTQEPTSKLGKIMAKVRAVERGVGRAWDWLEGHLQHPLRQFQAFILSHPILALVIDLVSDNLQRLIELKQWLKNNDKEAGFFKGVEDLQVGFKDEMENLLDTFQHIRLPDRVVPNNLIVEAIIDLILSRLGTKGKIARVVLDTLGLTPRISKLIDDKLLSNSLADPNNVWRDDILGLIQKRIDPIRDALVTDVYGFLAGPPLSFKMDPPATGQNKKLDGIGGDDFPEAAPYLDDQAPAQVAAPPSRLTPGSPLPFPVRSSAERRFGHDFSHVRLHTGSDAASVTGSCGAAGLASGSHVYISPSTPLTSPKGRQVFDHELTHVLQQTGPRPLGIEHSAAPSLGRQGAGLRLDAAQESAADRVSQTVQSRTGGGPIDPGPLKAGGFQPSILSIRVLRRFMRELTDVEKAKQAQRSFDAEAHLGHQDIADDQIKLGSDMWDAVRKMFDRFDLPTSSPNLVAVKDEFKTYFDGVAARIGGPIVQAIAFAVSEPEKSKKAGSEDPPERKLHPQRFVGGLEDYLLAKAGILINIKLDTDNRVEKVVVKNLLLDFVSSNTPLWTLAMTNAGIDPKEFEELRPILRAKLREINTKTAFLEARSGEVPALRFVWAGSKYAFHPGFVNQARETAKTLATKGRPDDLPSFREYLDHKNTSAGKQGIRIGKYGDNNQRSIPDRESHHTTQFLLIEYFRNLKDSDKPFPPSVRKDFGALGVLPPSGPEANKFQPPGAKAIDFAALDVGTRGDAMPAILIARPTHRQADLHVSGAKADDFLDGGIPVTQGEKVHSRFIGELNSAGAKPIAEAVYSPGAAEKMRAHVAQVGTSVAGMQVHKAISETYGWMHEHMMRTLEKGLHNNEAEYYQEIIAAHHTEKKGEPGERIHPDYDLQPDQMEPVFSAAQANNNAVMQAAGWIEP